MLLKSIPVFSVLFAAFTLICGVKKVLAGKRGDDVIWQNVVEQLSWEVTDLRGSVMALQDQMQELRDRLDSLHFAAQTPECCTQGNSPSKRVTPFELVVHCKSGEVNFQQLGKNHTQTKHIDFSPIGFYEPPVVTFGMSYLDAAENANNIGVAGYVSQVSPDGFDFTVAQWNHTVINGIRFQWMACP